MQLKPLWILTLAPALLVGGEYSKEDREALAQHLANSRAGLSSTLESLSHEQSKFKPESATWSALEIIEHLILIEDFLRGILIEAIAKSKPIPDTEALQDPSEMDAAIVRAVNDRSQKAKSPEQGLPQQRYENRDAAFLEFAQRRNKTIELVNTTKADLRRYRINSPMGPLDGHQWLLMLSAHTARHTKQIDDLGRHEMFPKQ